MNNSGSIIIDEETQPKMNSLVYLRAALLLACAELTGNDATDAMRLGEYFYSLAPAILNEGGIIDGRVFNGSSDRAQ